METWLWTTSTKTITKIMDAVHMKKSMTSSPASGASVRSTYRHGDLHRALLESGVELARAGGPEAVVLREATRRAGVVPNAAYRHFASRQALLQAVRAAALAAVARAMEVELAALPPTSRTCGLRPCQRARRGHRLPALRPGRDRPVPDRLCDPGRGRRRAAGNQGRRERPEPLRTARRRARPAGQAGAMPPERRPGAEFLAWSAVHGLALLRHRRPAARPAGAAGARRSGSGCSTWSRRACEYGV